MSGSSAFCLPLLRRKGPGRAGDDEGKSIAAKSSFSPALSAATGRAGAGAATEALAVDAIAVLVWAVRNVDLGFDFGGAVIGGFLFDRDSAASAR